MAATGGAIASLSGAAIISAIKASGVEYILSVPDIVTSAGLLAPIAHDSRLRLIRVCKEDECVGIASGLSYSDKRALILIQHTGLLDSINAIRGIAVEFKQPICLMVGLLQHNPDVAPCASPSYGVRIVEPILEAMGIAHHLIGTDADVGKITPGIEAAYRDSHPVAFLIGRSPS
jgi:sulfopyruvate decarboxylase subunit alpha